MEILRKPGDFNVILNQENLFQTNLGWEEGMDIFEDEVLSTIINPIDNYETIRYIHEPYDAVISGTTVNQCDIWFKFFFVDANTTYNNGLDYSLVGIAPKDNANMIKTSTESYFRLEFFKTPNDEPPTRMNRKIVFSKNLQLPIGEKFYYNTLRQNIHIPVFMGSNYRNKENMYLFWFQDDTVLSDSTLSGDTFYMTAKFLNANDGSIIDFTNSKLTTTTEIIESADLYYKVVINKSNYTYKVFNYNGTQNERVGNGLSNSINFYEKGGENINAPAPSRTPAPTPSRTPAPTQTPVPTPSRTPAASPGGGRPPAQLYTYYLAGEVLQSQSSTTYCASPGYIMTLTVQSTAPVVSLLLSTTILINGNPFIGQGSDFIYAVSATRRDNTFINGPTGFQYIKINALGEVIDSGVLTCSGGGGGSGTSGGGGTGGAIT
jgi:hypothetical protein